LPFWFSYIFHYILRNLNIAWQHIELPTIPYHLGLLQSLFSAGLSCK